MGDHISPSSLGPGRSIGADSLGPAKIGKNKGGGAFKEKGLGKEPSMLPKGYGVYGRVPNVEKDGDPFTRRSPNQKKPGSNSFL